MICWYQQPAILAAGMKPIFQPLEPELDSRPHVRRFLGELQDQGPRASGEWRQLGHVWPDNDEDVLDLSPA